MAAKLSDQSSPTTPEIVSNKELTGQDPVKSTLENAVYLSKNHSYSLTFPSSWVGKVQVVENKDATSFYYQPEASTLAHLFTIEVKDEKSWTENLNGDNQKLLAKNGKVYIAAFPLGHPFEDHNANQFQEYTAMLKEVQSILKTFSGN